MSQYIALRLPGTGDAKYLIIILVKIFDCNMDLLILFLYVSTYHMTISMTHTMRFFNISMKDRDKLYIFIFFVIAYILVLFFLVFKAELHVYHTTISFFTFWVA